MKKLVLTILSAVISCSFLSADVFACTGVYAGPSTTANGSVYMGRSEDLHPDYAKQFIIVPAADHKSGDCLEDDYGFSVPYPSHTLRYSAVMDDPSEYSGLTKIPYAEAGINEKGVCVSASISTHFNRAVLEADPLTSNGITEISMTSYVLQSAESARDGVQILAECIDTYGHGNSTPGDPEGTEVSTVLIADSEETWVFEAVSGHQYAATKLSDDTVAVLPNVIMTQQINVSDENVIVSDGLISTAKAGGFYASDVEGDNEIHVAKSYSAGYDYGTSYRFYYGAHILNQSLADSLDVVPKPVSDTSGIYPNADVEKEAIGPFYLQFEPSDTVTGTIGLMTLWDVLGSHGEGTPYETTSWNVNTDGEPMRSIGTYTQNEEHIFEIRKDDSIPTSVTAVEWLAMAPSEFSVYVPFYTAAMTETPEAYTTETYLDFDPESIYWLFNEIGNTGNGHYYRVDQNGAYYDRYGEKVDTATAEAVLDYLADEEFVEGIRQSMKTAQKEVIAKFDTDDQAIRKLAESGTEEEVTAMANKLAVENADLVKEIASEQLSEIDGKVSEFIATLDPADE